VVQDEESSQLGARLHGGAPFAMYDHFLEQQLGEPVALRGSVAEETG
jgi:hypothetical protein